VPPAINSGASLAFIKNALSIETDDCIIFPFSLFKNGYGQVTFNGKKTQAHRVSCWLAYGPPPKGKNEALHAPVICHNRACINKRHLRWEVVEIYTSSRPHKRLSESYGVSVGAISKIKCGRRWQHVTSAL